MDRDDHLPNANNSDNPADTLEQDADATNSPELSCAEASSTEVSNAEVSNPEGRNDMVAIRTEVYRLKSNLSNIERRFVNAKRVQKDRSGALQTQLDQISDCLNGLMRSAEHDRQAVAASQVQWAKQRDQMGSVKQEHHDLVQQLETQLPRWSAQIETQLASLDAVKNKFDAKTEAMNALENSLSMLQAELARLVESVKKSWSEEQALRQAEDEQRRQTWQSNQQDMQDLKSNMLEAMRTVAEQREAVSTELAGIQCAFDAELKTLASEKEALDALRMETKKMILVSHAARKVAIKYNSATAERVEEIAGMTARAEHAAQCSGERLGEFETLKAAVEEHVETQRDVHNKLMRETQALEQLCRTVEQYGQDVEHSRDEVKQCVQSVTDSRDHVVDLAAQVRDHLAQIQGAMDHYARLEAAFASHATQIEQALLEQQRGLERVDQLSEAFDHTNTVVAGIQSQWGEWSDTWENMCSANDDHYRNLVALLDRSRQNEGALAQLMDAVRALETRSEHLLETAEEQLKQQDALAEQTLANCDQTQTIQAVAEAASHQASDAADRAEACEQRVAVSTRDVMAEQQRLLSENSQQAKKIAEAHTWIKQALAKTQHIKTHADAVLQRQEDLEQRAQALLTTSQARDEKCDALMDQVQSLADTIDTRWHESEKTQEQIDASIGQLADFLKSAHAEQEALRASSSSAQAQMEAIMAAYQRVTEQTETAQQRIQDSERGVQNMLEQVNDQLVVLRTQGETIDGLVQRGTTINEQWEAHQSHLSQLEAQSQDALQGSQRLQATAQDLMNSAASDHESIHDAVSRVNALSAQITEAVAAEKQLREQADALLTGLNEQHRQQEAVASEQAAMSLRTEVMHDQITDAEKRTTDKLAELEEIRQQAKSLLTENVALQRGLSEAHEQIANLAERAEGQMDTSDGLCQKTEARFAAAQDTLDEIQGLLPRLANDMARFEKVGTDYTQWDARLKSQSLSLKESEGTLRELCKRLDVGLQTVAEMQGTVDGVVEEFGNIKRVVAQILQKFKSFDQKNAEIETRCSSLATEQAELANQQNEFAAQREEIVRQHAIDRDRITQLEAETRQVPEVPEPMREAVQKLEVQERFNDQVLKNFERIAQHYVKASQHHAIVEPLQQRHADVEARLSRLEEAMERLLNPSTSMSDLESRLSDVDHTVTHQESALTEVGQDVLQLREELNALRSTCCAMTVAAPAGHPRVAAPARLADTETERAVESEVTETTDQASTLETVSDAKALIDPLEESIETNSAPAQRLVEDIEINGLRDQESELDLLSQQLEKISADSLFHENEIERLKRHNMGKKTFLFSLFVLISSVNFSAWSPSDVLPTFAHQRFAVDLSHPALQRVGPMKSTEGVPQIRATQRHYLHTVGDSVLSLQWPLPDRKAGEGVQYGLASNALYLESSPYTPVLSIAPGQVVFSGPSAGQFGVMVIVQHRDELLSVYGYLHDTWVDPGQMVRSGQVIARVGESQWSDPRLYFEMRYQGRSEDPYLYFSS